MSAQPYAGLLERLHTYRSFNDLGVSVSHDICPEAAEAISSLLKALTPSAETKAAYIGEFKFSIELAHPRLGSNLRSVAVPWTTIKEIMAAIKAHALNSDAS